MAEKRSNKTKIAILGGGIAALTTAFELTEHDPNEDYEITIYTLGWRLGGKGAVGRDAARYDRAYEHGLHIWAGFYDNAFDVVQRLYERLGEGKDAWRSFFRPLNHFTVMENLKGEWSPWLVAFPPNPKTPGLHGETAFSPWPMLVQFLALFESAFRESEHHGLVSDESRRAFAEQLAQIGPLGQPGAFDEIALTTTARAAQQLSVHAGAIDENHREALRLMLDKSKEQIFGIFLTKELPQAGRRLRIILDLAFALARGLLSDEAFLGGFDAIDDIEFSQWMIDNGCDPENLDSAIVRGCYDYAFVSKAKGIGAGTAALLGLRFLLTYKGSVLHELAEPMGDFIFARMYEYLTAQKKVKFEFFCRVDEIALNKDGLVESVTMGQQVELIDASKPYEPLIKRKDGRPSWPAAPRADQIKHGEWLTPGGPYANPDLESHWTDWPDAKPRVLKRRMPGDGDDKQDVFDLVVLGLGFYGLKQICNSFRNRVPGWTEFLDGIATTQTAALQLWLLKSTAELGWTDPCTALTGFELPGEAWQAAPMTSWEDNTGLLRQEHDRVDKQPRSLAYFCGIFPDYDPIPPRTETTFPDHEWSRVWTATEDWMNSRLLKLWPKAASSTTSLFDPDVLESLDSTQSIAKQHYFKVNIDPSERYVLSIPCSSKYRLPPDKTGVANLFLAGDFVRSGVNAGCIEAAVIAGRMTARAITEADMAISGDSNHPPLSVPISALPLINIIDKLKSLASGGIGSIEAYCATVPVPKKDVAALLPQGAGLELVTPAKWGDYHPIMLVFSRQRHVRPSILPFGGVNYLEFVEMIPNVTRTSPDAPTGGPFTYMPYLLLDQPLAVALGQNIYGFNKRMARLSADDGAFVVKSDLGELQTNLSGVDLPGSLNKIPSIKRCHSFLGQPFIAMRPTGEWVYSYLDYRLESATYQKIAGDIVAGPPFTTFMSTINLEKLKNMNEYKLLDLTWFRFTSQWRLSLPLTSGEIPDTAVSGQISSTVSQWTGGRFGGFFSR